MQVEDQDRRSDGLLERFSVAVSAQASSPAAARGTRGVVVALNFQCHRCFLGGTFLLLPTTKIGHNKSVCGQQGASRGTAAYRALTGPPVGQIRLSYVHVRVITCRYQLNCQELGSKRTTGFAWAPSTSPGWACEQLDPRASPFPSSRSRWPAGGPRDEAGSVNPGSVLAPS